VLRQEGLATVGARLGYVRQRILSRSAREKRALAADLGDEVKTMATSAADKLRREGYLERLARAGAAAGRVLSAPALDAVFAD